MSMDLLPERSGSEKPMRENISGVKTLRAEDTEAADEIREKHESLRRRKMLRSQEKI